MIQVTGRIGEDLDDVDFADALEASAALMETRRHEGRMASLIASPLRGERADKVAPWAWVDWSGKALGGRSYQELRESLPQLRGRRIARLMRDKGISEEEAAASVSIPKERYDITPWIDDAKRTKNPTGV